MNARARLVARLAAILDEDDPARLARRLRPIRVTTFRENPLRATTGEALAALARDGIASAPVAVVNGHRLVDEGARDALLAHDAVTSGAIYVQTLSSLVAPTLLAPRPGDEVLDLAAAPGGKAIHLAAQMQNQGRLAVVEPSRDRFFRLKANLERAGVTIAALYQKDGATIGAKVPERFDRVLVDAPCSTEARLDPFDDDAELFGWSEKKIARLARLQGALLESGLRALKPGGRLVYSTCSFAPEENEAVIAAALARFGDAVVVVPPSLELPFMVPGKRRVLGLELPPDVEHARRVLPAPGFEAAFVCALEKRRSFDDDVTEAGGVGRADRRARRGPRRR